MTIDKGKIIEKMSQGSVLGNDEGLIPAFGVHVQQLPTCFWNGFARRIVNAVPEDLIEAAEHLLINAAHECGYHTGHGILTSEEFRQVVQPMVNADHEREDLLAGLFAVCSAWGWARTEIVELIPSEHLVVRADDYYESDVMLHGRASRPSAYMIRGVCGAFMDLIYGGPYDATGKSGLHTFQCQQVMGLEIGDAFGEFVVTRA